MFLCNVLALPRMTITQSMLERLVVTCTRSVCRHYIDQIQFALRVLIEFGADFEQYLNISTSQTFLFVSCSIDVTNAVFSVHKSSMSTIDSKVCHRIKMVHLALPKS